MGGIRRLVVLATVMVLAAGAAVAAPVKVGQPLPAISGRSLADGATMDVNAMIKGTPAVLAFWSIYCKPCVAEIASLVGLEARYRGKLAVIGVNMDGALAPTRVRTFLDRYRQFEKKDISYPIVFDEGNVISKDLGVGFLPTVLVVDAAGTVVGSYVGFEEQDEAAIFQGVERLLPLGTAPASIDSSVTFEVDLSVPVCGFYDEEGWRESFYGNKDRSVEGDKAALVARELALKAAMRQALGRLGVMLAEHEGDMGCTKPHGIEMRESPWKCPDPLTNLLNVINFRKYTRVLDTSERWVGTDYRIRQRITVVMDDLKDDLGRAGVVYTPRRVTFVVINLRDIDRARFLDALLAQSKFIGQADFPAFTIYAEQDAFVAELEKMTFDGGKVFFSEAGEGVVEAELWR